MRAFQISNFPSNAGAVSQNSSRFDFSCPSVSGMSDFHRIYEPRQDRMNLIYCHNWIATASLNLNNIFQACSTRFLYILLTFSWRRGRFFVETESGSEVESLNAADGLRLPLPSLRRLVVPTQPPITTRMYLAHGWTFLNCFYHSFYTVWRTKGFILYILNLKLNKNWICHNGYRRFSPIYILKYDLCLP